MRSVLLASVAVISAGVVALVAVGAVVVSRFELFPELSGECGGFVSSAPPAPEATPVERAELAQYGAVAYVFRGLWIAGADGSGRRRIARIEARPPLSWSPNGRQLAFGDGDDLYLVDAGGSSLRRLTRAEGRDVEPMWSPDGSHLAFASDRDGNFDIYVMRVDGRNVTQVTRTQGVDHAPAWSPDGRLIVFEGARTGLGDRSGSIEVVRSNGSGRRPVKAPPVAFAPAWSPEGTRIAIGGRSAGARHERIYVVDVRTGTRTPIGAEWNSVFARVDRARVTRPRWSPDGRTIVFAAGPRRKPWLNLVVVADASGGDSELVSDMSDYNGAFDPVWSSDGERLVFLGASSLESGLALYSWRRGGYDERDCNDVRRLTPYLRLTASPSGGETLAWQPVR